jgi:hypothetical protein
MRLPEATSELSFANHNVGLSFQETFSNISKPISGALRLCGDMTGFDPRGNVCVVSVGQFGEES